MAANTIQDATMLTTQPVVFGVAGMTFMGLAVNEWILIGTGVLLVLNLALVPFRLYNEYRRSKKDA